MFPISAPRVPITSLEFPKIAKVLGNECAARVPAQIIEDGNFSDTRSTRGPELVSVRIKNMFFKRLKRNVLIIS